MAFRWHGCLQCISHLLAMELETQWGGMLNYKYVKYVTLQVTSIYSGKKEREDNISRPQQGAIRHQTETRKDS